MSKLWKEYFAPVSLIAISIAVSILFIAISSYRELSSLENTLFQIFCLVFGFVGSYCLGKKTAKSEAQNIVSPHARAAFRRIVTIYKSIGRVFTLSDTRSATDKDCRHTLNTIHELMDSQMGQIDDAMEDWRDIVPDEVNRIETNRRNDSV